LISQKRWRISCRRELEPANEGLPRRRHFCAQRYELRVSQTVREEASAGSPKYSTQRMRILDGIKLLEEDQRSRMLTTSLIGNGMLPPKAALDAEHIAIAAIHSICYLLTWNCKHLANPIISRNVVRTCERHGFECPVICTPEQLMQGYTHD
jgi:hypothetical protein